MESRKKLIRLDVREDIRRGQEPFSKIMTAVAKLGPDDELLLIAPFEPAPLYAVLASHALTASPQALESGDYEVLFSRQPQPTASAAIPQPKAEHACEGSPVVEVDARGLEPPQPLVAILEAVAALPKGARLRAFTDRRPMHLYTQLMERGYSGQTDEQPDGSFVTYVRPLQ